MIATLTRKLVRDLLRLRGQVVTIALVVAAGIAIFIAFQSVYASLLGARELYYQRYRFADVFAALERAPESLADAIAGLPGVAQVDTRVRAPVRVLVPDVDRPPSGVLLSLPDAGPPRLGALHLTAGRMPEPGHGDEVVLLAGFAEKHAIAPGAGLDVIVAGAQRRLVVVGHVLSPEYVFAAGGGELIPDGEGFTALWMRRAPLAAAVDMSGAFNDVALRRQPGASERAVLAELDRVLRPYGGLGAVGRAQQPSEFILHGELQQLEGMARALPVVFLLVAAFLLNVVLSRLVYLQRGQIATLKAVGYSNAQVGLHFFRLVAVVVLLGAGIGIAVGAWLGRALHGLYGEYFRFPVQHHGLDGATVAAAVLLSLAAAAVGAFFAVRSVIRLPPAEAMKPAPPLTYRLTLVDRLRIGRLLSPPTRMVARELSRRPLRTALSVLGISMAVATLILGRFSADSVGRLMVLLFDEMWREDVLVIFPGPVPERAVRGLAHIPGVLRAEGLRITGARISHAGRHREASIQAYPATTTLRAPVDGAGRSVPLPDDGIMLTAKLAELLDVRVGDEVEVELREGRRATLRMTVAATLDEPAGLQGHVRLELFARLAREAPAVSAGLLVVDPNMQAGVLRELQALPTVAGVSAHAALRRRFDEQTARSMGVMTVFATLFAGVIAVGVVYNNARVALSVRERDLATLRVVGFTRREVSAILLGELGIQVLAAIPVGCYFGAEMATAMMNTTDPERFRFPAVISSSTYAFAAVVTLAAGLVSALLVRRKLDTLDLIAVLKTRE